MSADITLYARRTLAESPSVVALVGSSPDWPKWIWRHRAQEPIEGSGKCAVVLRVARGWAASNRRNSAAFPQLEVAVLADHTRDASGKPTKADAEEKALTLAAEIRKVLNHPEGGEITWGNEFGAARVVSSDVAGEPTLSRLAPESEGEAVRASQTFDLVVA